MKKLWINRFYIGKLATNGTGVIFAFIGIINTLVPLDSIFSEKISFCRRIIITLLIVAGVWLLCFIGCSFFVLIIKRIKLYEVNNGHSVYVQYGDLFSDNIISDNDKKRNIVIPVNRCFDTIVDNEYEQVSFFHKLKNNCLKNLQNPLIYHLSHAIIIEN